LRQLNENTLIDQVNEGNTGAFKELVNRYERPVSNVVIGLLGNTAEAEEIAQDVFIRFYKNSSRFRKESSLKTYLTRIAINLSLNELKKRKRTKERFVAEEEINVPYGGESEDSPSGYDLKEAVEIALQQLDVRQRAVFVLRIIEGYDTSETAKILNIPKGTVLSRLHRAQEHMRKLLQHFF